MTTNDKIFNALKNIYFKEGECNKIFNFCSSSLKKEGLTDEDLLYLKSGECPYGRLSLYFGVFGEYYAVNLPESFYKRYKLEKKVFV